MPAVLFLCPDGAARGPMAEAIVRHLLPGVDAWSAAWMPGHVRKGARSVLRAHGVETRGLRARGILEIDFREIDLIVMLSDEPGCPHLPAGIPIEHAPFVDPDSAPPSSAEESYLDTFDAMERLLPALLARALPA